MRACQADFCALANTGQVFDSQPLCGGAQTTDRACPSLGRFMNSNPTSSASHVNRAVLVRVGHSAVGMFEQVVAMLAFVGETALVAMG